MSSTGHLSELDLLRGQVADLSRELAARDRALREQSLHLDRERQDVREQSEMLRAIVEGTAAETGEEFFVALVTHLTSVLKVQYAVIGEVQGDRIKKIHTLAVSAGGTLAGNFEYELAHTPCATALTQTFACFARDVQATFPQFQRLADLGAESYCAVPLRTKGGAVIGLLIVMDTKPLQHGDYLQSLLEIFAPRVAVEFERRRAEQERAQALADLHNVMETVPDIMFTLDNQGNLVKWNRRLVDVTGYSPEELLNKSALAFVPPEEQTSTAAAIQRAFTDGYAELDGHLLTKEHRIIPYHWIGALLKNPQGEPIGITGIGRDVSEKKRAEVELRLQRRRLVDAQALAHLGSWDWDVDTGEVEWSDEQFRIFGYEPGAIAVTYDTFLASLHPDDHDPVLAAINDALLGKRPCDVEYRIARPNGEVRFIHVRGEVHRDAAGHPLGMAGTVLDITEWKQTEQALRSSEERWQLAVRGSNDGIWDWNIRTGDIFFSPRWKAMRGFEDHDITNHVDEWRSRIHPDDLDRVLESIDAYLAKQTPEFCEEYRVQKKDGSYMWILDRGMALWADDGTPLRMAGSETDIAERRRTEDSLRQSEERFRTIFAQSPIGIAFIESLTGQIQEVNARYVQIAGRTIEELLGLDWMSISHTDDVQADLGNMAKLFTGDIAGYQMEKRLVHSDGTIAWIHLTVAPIQIEAHAGPHHLAMMQDITARKQAEEALRQSEGRLRSFMMNSPSLVFFKALDGRYLYVNREFERLFQLPEGHIIGKTDYDVFPCEQADQFAVNDRRVLQEGHALETEETANYQDGTHTSLVMKFPVCGSDGAVWGIGGIVTDITPRKQAEALLRISEEGYRALYDDTPTMYFTLAADCTVRSVNRFGAEQLGYQVEELVGHSALNVCHEHDKESLAANLSECLAAPETTRRWDCRKVRKDGSMMWVQETACVAQSSTGEAVLLVTGENITNRKINEQILAGEKRILEMIATDVPLQEVLTLMCQVFEGLSSRAHCSILLLDPDGLHLRHSAAPSLPEAYVHAIDGLAIGPTVGCCGTAAFMRRQVIVSDIARDPLWADFRDLALRHGLRACWSTPVISSDGTVLGTFAVYYREPQQPTDTDLRLIERTAHIACIAIERKRTEEALREKQFQLTEAQRLAKVGSWYWTVETDSVTWSDELYAIFGKDPSQPAVSYKDHPTIYTADSYARLDKAVTRALAMGEPYELELEFIHADGTQRWGVARGEPIQGNNGQIVRLHGTFQDVTERKGAEDVQKRLITELAESQKHFERIFHWTPSAVAISTLAEGRLLDVNDRLVQLTGYSREELIGRTTTELQLWADPPERARVIQEILQQRSLHNKEGLLRTKFGDIRAIMVSVDRIEVNATPCLIYVAHDITARKQTEEKLRLSEQRQELALSGANLGLWDWDVSAGKAVFDARWCSMIGYAMDELEPHASTWLSLLHPEDAPAIQTILESHLKNETPDYEGEFRMRHKAGHWIWILARGRVVERDHAGAPLRMAGTHMDITDRKRAEEAIREAELRYRTIFERAGVGVAQVESRTGQFVQVNRQYCEILGMTEAEMLATTFEAVTHPDDLKRDRESMTRLLSGEIPAFTMEKRYVHKDGSIVWVNLNVAPLWRSGETPVHHISIVQDITERKRAENALRRSECQLRTVLDALPVGVWFTDQRGKPVLSNPAAKEIWSGIKQIRLETAANTPGWWEAIGPSSELHRWALSHALTKGVPSLNETLHLECLDGTEKVIRNTTVPVQDEAGVVLGAIVLNEDITALRQAQEALKLTQFSVDHAVEGFFWIGPDARILNVNDAACRMLEYTRDELTTMTMHDIDPNFPPEIWSAHWEELKQKKSMTFESKHWSKTGRVLDTEVTINFLYYEGSEYNCAIMRDIGERKQANAALRVSEDRFRSIFQNEPECVKAVAPDGTLLVMNPAGLIMVGARFEEEVIGKSVLSLIYPDDRSAFQKLHQGVCSGESGSLQFRIKSLQAEVRWVDTHSVPLRDAAGGVTAALSITRDITERKRIEETLSRRERDLRAAVEERQRISQDLHDGILQSLFAVGLGLEASKSTMPPRIRKTSGPPLDQAIKQLNCVMHEIRNFIAGLGSDLLQGKDLPAALKQMLASLTQNQAMRVRLAVEDRAAQAVSAEQSLNLFHVIQEAVSNCIRHGRAQETRVSLKMLKQGVRLSIRDDGRGFNPETAKGSGHGLSNMAARAQKIGGRFTVLSKVNEGTRIVLDLPKEASYGRR